MTHGSSPPVLVFWGRSTGRLRDIAKSVGGTVLEVYDPRLVRKPLVPLRYLLSAWRTIRALERLGPGAVVVTNPPIFAPLTVGLWCRARGARLVLDSHPDAFGVRGLLWRAFLPVHRVLARGAVATLVTTDELARRVEAWGGRGLVLHEPPPAHDPRPSRAPGERPRVLVVANFGYDEPMDAIIDAADDLVECDMRITGDPRKAPRELLARAGSNLTFTGWLATPEYLAEVEAADVVVGLTTDGESVMRCAYEAVYLERVLVASDTEPSRRYFSPGVFTDNRADSIARAIRAALREHERWRAEAPDRRKRQLARWRGQETELAAALRPDAA